MPKKIILHVDGSRVLADNRKNQSFGWAVLALHADKHEEFSGHRKDRVQSALSGHHEHLAFVEGVLLAHRLGYSMDEVVINTDDMLFGYAPSDLHPQNYRGANAQRIEDVARHVVHHGQFPYGTLDLVLSALRTSLVNKVKGHRKHVYQERVDYLAKSQAWAPLDPSRSVHMDFDTWLARGLKDWSAGEDGSPVYEMWYPPFVGLPAEQTPAL